MSRRTGGVQPGRTAGFRATAGLTATAAAGLALLAGCGGESPESAAAGSAETAASLTVVASILPVADLVEQVGGDRVEVRILLQPGAAPSTFEATPSTLRMVEGAGLLIRVGGGLDGWTEEVMSSSSAARVVTLLEGIPLIDDGHVHEDGSPAGGATGAEPDGTKRSADTERSADTGNPHVWLDPIRTRDELLPRITAALSASLPDVAAELEARAEAFADSLTALDAEIRSALSDLESRAFVAGHPAWTYFAERYDLVQLGVVHESPGREPAPRSIATLVDRAREAGVPVVFTEPQLPGQGSRAIASELGVPLVPLDPLGVVGVEGRDSYLGLMRYNTGQFVRGLGSAAP